MVLFKFTELNKSIFTRNFFKFIFISAKYYYNEIVRHTILFLFRPHLIIYLDVPVDKTMENIKKRNRDLEVNGKALTREFLQAIDDNYKNFYLREAGYYAHQSISPNYFECFKIQFFFLFLVFTV